MKSFLLLFLVSCGGTDAVVDEASQGHNTHPVVVDSPDLPPQPAPLMRQAVMCCSDLPLERIVAEFVNLTESLVTNDLTLVAEAHEGFVESLQAAESGGEIIAKILTDALALDLSSLDSAREGFGPISDELINKVRDSSSASGQYDLAIGYSRDADHHWIQLGVEPSSPYGDGINSYSWGTREEVRTADAAREVEMGNNQYGGHN